MKRAKRSKRKAKAATPRAAAAPSRIGRLTRVAEVRLFDRAAREFLRKWRAGEFKNADADPAVRHVAMLAPVGC